MWARKRHRGGGGLAVPGPVNRIARAGGQKVTIRSLKRPLFLPCSAPWKKYCAVRRKWADELFAGKDGKGDRVTADLPVEWRAELAGKAFDDPFELVLGDVAIFTVRKQHRR